METVIKLAPAQYEKLRRHILNDSIAYDAVEKATRIDHSIDGVLFEGYSLTCDERQAEELLKIAKSACPEIVGSIEKTIKNKI